MILTIKGANFSTAGIGTLNTVSIKKTLGRGITHNIPNFINKDASANWTLTLGENYEFGTYSVTMGGTTIAPTVSGNTMTISISKVTAVVNITVATTYIGTEEEPPVTPEPEQPGTGGGSGTTTSIKVTDFSDKYRAMVNATTGQYTNQSFNENMGGSQVINKYDIPSGATQVNYQTFKTGAGYGSGFEDAGGNWISGYANTDPNLKRHTLNIPNNASKFVFMYPDNGYADYMGSPRFDYIEFLGVFEGSGESPESPDSGNTESVKSYTFTTDVRGLLDTTNGAVSGVGDASKGSQVINNHTIPSGAKTVKYQVFKTGKTYGSGFVDAGGNWISGFAANSGEKTGDWKTLSIPSNATVFKHMYPDNEYIKTMTGYDSSWDFQYVEFLFS
jgi:hypothetical protein